MRLATLAVAGRTFVAARKGDAYIDLTVAAPDLPADLSLLLEDWVRTAAKVRIAVQAASSAAVVDTARARFLPLVPNPGKVLCLGLNYLDHAAESHFDKPEWPVVFARFMSSIVGQNEPLVAPSVSAQFDYEAELAVVIGKAGRAVSRENALDLVAGYSVFNDGSIRDYQFKSNQWTVGKNFDATGAFGPELVTADELPAGAAGLRISTRLNGQVVQDANTSDMIFGVAETLSLLSEAMTLLPGDVVVMGTPSGVGLARKPPLWMKAGDICEVEIEGVGLLSNPVVSEADAARHAA
ncbi:fumarylacetoacetate hydrolase family protein [Bosea sp. PAMC 26642]|uniref:fumarylacetoacetate hydrolase family protein n=1 Tax=Bosea sp. (strain PAMC 26642) TaxID=1792307 RepID=UPI0007705FEF|nr:fumarylacetoacetate hydrolase family protein [Bosea sp. PAMC 26642]AMJ61127.1 hypothetical protein AXW83_13235 [Bosea sp. PAMC 26642]